MMLWPNKQIIVKIAKLTKCNKTSLNKVRKQKQNKNHKFKMAKTWICIDKFEILRPFYVIIWV